MGLVVLAEYQAVVILVEKRIVGVVSLTEETRRGVIRVICEQSSQGVCVGAAKQAAQSVVRSCCSQSAKKSSQRRSAGGFAKGAGVGIGGIGSEKASRLVVLIVLRACQAKKAPRLVILVILRIVLSKKTTRSGRLVIVLAEKSSRSAVLVAVLAEKPTRGVLIVLAEKARGSGVVLGTGLAKKTG